jgi:hypothetical protein
MKKTICDADAMPLVRELSIIPWLLRARFWYQLNTGCHCCRLSLLNADSVEVKTVQVQERFNRLASSSEYFDILFGMARDVMAASFNALVAGLPACRYDDLQVAGETAIGIPAPPQPRPGMDY